MYLVKLRSLAPSSVIVGKPGESKKKVTSLAGRGIKSMRPIFTTKLSIYQSIAKIDVKILFGKITHHLVL